MEMKYLFSYANHNDGQKAFAASQRRKIKQSQAKFHELLGKRLSYNT